MKMGLQPVMCIMAILVGFVLLSTTCVADTNSIPPSADTNKTSAASPKLSVNGGLTDKEIEAFQSECTDTNKGSKFTYLITASMSRSTPAAKDLKRYVKSGKIPFTISIQLYQQVTGQKALKPIYEGKAHFYIVDSDGNVIVKPRTDELLKLCRH
jgi:hypothetical protein